MVGIECLNGGLIGIPMSSSTFLLDESGNSSNKLQLISNPQLLLLVFIKYHRSTQIALADSQLLFVVETMLKMAIPADSDQMDLAKPLSHKAPYALALTMQKQYRSH